MNAKCSAVRPFKHKLQHRDQRAKETVFKLAGLPIIKTLEIFDFSSSNINQMQVQELANLGFVHNKENVIFCNITKQAKNYMTKIITSPSLLY